MAEVNTADAEQKAEASFGEGFGVTPPVETAKVVEQTPAEPVAEPPAAPAPAPVPEKPKYARVLQSDFDNLKAAAGKVASLESQVARMNQTLGDTAQLEQRIVEKVKSLTPAGLTVDLSDEDFADLAAEFPELAKHTRSTLERVFKKAGVRGTGPTESPSIKEEDFDKGIDKALQRREAAALVKAYPEWSTIVGQVDLSKGEKPSETNEFRQWLGRQSAEYQKEINDTDSPAEVRSAIDKFMASKTAAPTPTAKPDRGAVRRAIVEDAVTPRTDGGSPPMRSPPPSADEAFEQGFKQARGRQAHA